ncbi:hypothetical protein VTO58DRAFT_106866 [Aureobasidium pullulans]
MEDPYPRPYYSSPVKKRKLYVDAEDKTSSPALLSQPPRVLKSVTSSHLTATPRAVWTVEMHNVFNISAALH